MSFWDEIAAQRKKGLLHLFGVVTFGLGFLVGVLGVGALGTGHPGLRATLVVVGPVLLLVGFLLALIGLTKRVAAIAGCACLVGGAIVTPASGPLVGIPAMMAGLGLLVMSVDWRLGGASTEIPYQSAVEAPPLRNRQLVAVVLAFAIASVALRAVFAAKLETSSLLFIGIPTLFALVLALTPRATSPIAIAMKGITIGLALSAILLGEGVICLLMAAPLFYTVGLIVGIVVEKSHKRKDVLGLALAPLWLLALEGTTERLSFERHETVTVRHVVAASPANVEAALARTPRFAPLPAFLRIGFPRPVWAAGQGLAKDDRRTVRFEGGEGEPGNLVLVVSERGPSSVSFRAVEDHSKIADWLRWERAVVAWSAVDPTHTAVSWTLEYRRGLDPAWYFRPSERYAVGVTAGYLIDSLATP